MRSLCLPPVSHRGIATVEPTPREHTIRPSNLVGGADLPRFKPIFGPCLLANHPVTKYSAVTPNRSCGHLLVTSPRAFVDRSRATGRSSHLVPSHVTRSPLRTCVEDGRGKPNQGPTALMKRNRRNSSNWRCRPTVPHDQARRVGPEGRRSRAPHDPPCPVRRTPCATEHGPNAQANATHPAREPASAVASVMTAPVFTFSTTLPDFYRLVDIRHKMRGFRSSSIGFPLAVSQASLRDQIQSLYFSLHLLALLELSDRSMNTSSPVNLSWETAQLHSS